MLIINNIENYLPSNFFGQKLFFFFISSIIYYQSDFETYTVINQPSNNNKNY